MKGYRRLHQMTEPPEQYMVEISTLRMLTNGNYDASEVLKDVEAHFDAYFTLPLPARVIALQGLSCPCNLTPTQAALYRMWGQRLEKYAREQAMADLDEYERTLPSDYVNERCWVILQRVDFTRRSNQNYDGQQVLQWMREIVQIHRDHGQLLNEIEAEVNIVKQYGEMVYLGQLTPADAEPKMREMLTDAYNKAEQLPAMILGAVLIELAFFSANLGDPAQAQKAWDRFCDSGQSVTHFSKEIQEKAAYVMEIFTANCINQA
jgi:hypothetical protein